MSRSVQSFGYRRRVVAGIAGVAILLAAARFVQTLWTAPATHTSGSLTAASDDSYEKGLLPFLRQYCADCHGDGAHEGDFTYDRYQDDGAVKRDRDVWTKVLKKMKSEAMPPADADKPPA